MGTSPRARRPPSPAPRPRPLRSAAGRLARRRSAAYSDDTFEMAPGPDQEEPADLGQGRLRAAGFRVAAHADSVLSLAYNGDVVAPGGADETAMP
jgi:hypothetical protein